MTHDGTAWDATGTGVLTVSTGGNVTFAGHLQAAGPAAPAAAIGGNNGSGGASPVVTTGSNDGGGTITFGSGSGPSANVQVAVTFGGAWVIPGGGAPHIVVTPGNDATQQLGLFVAGESPTGFNLCTHSAPAASQGNTVYKFFYVVIG